MNNAMKKKSVCAILAAVVAASSGVAIAADYTWDNGGADGRWATGDNWYNAVTNNTPPQDNDTAIFGSTLANRGHERRRSIRNRRQGA